MPQERVLVADDEADVRRMCVRALELDGYWAVGVGSGEEAIDLARQETFDVLLTDLKMPRVDGLEACRTIRAFQPDLITVIMTGFGTLDVAIEALQLGVSEFLLKPFRPTELTAAVRRALSKRQLERENARLKALIPLFDLSREFMNSVDLAAIPELVVRIAKEETHADTASLMLLNDQGELTIHSAAGLPPEVVAKTRQRANEGIAGYVVAHRQPVILQGDLSADRRFEQVHGVRGIKSAISLPIIHKDQVLGVLNVAKVQDDAVPFNEADVDLLSVLSSQAAVAIDNARLFAEIQTAYQRLSELDQLKSEFIRIAAHELRTPLAIVLSYAALLEEEATGPMRDHLTVVTQAAMQLKSIIDEMLSLRRLDTGEAQVNITAVHVADVVAGVLEDLRLLAERKRQRITVALPDDLAPVRADQQMLHLVLSNLVSNAIKFTAEEGAIQIAAQRQDESIVISVSDTGEGIPENELERIFQRFYQVEDPYTRQHEGIGLGLAIAKEMIEFIGGRIWVKSQLGQGSTFFISLPQAGESEGVAMRSSTEETALDA